MVLSENTAGFTLSDSGSDGGFLLIYHLDKEEFILDFSGLICLKAVLTNKAGLMFFSFCFLPRDNQSCEIGL